MSVWAMAQTKSKSFWAEVTCGVPPEKRWTASPLGSSYSCFCRLSVFLLSFFFFKSLIVYLCPSRKSNAYLILTSKCCVTSPLCFKNHQHDHHLKLCNPGRESDTITNDPLKDQQAHFKAHWHSWPREELGWIRLNSHFCSAAECTTQLNVPLKSGLCAQSGHLP